MSLLLRCSPRPPFTSASLICSVIFVTFFHSPTNNRKCSAVEPFAVASLAAAVAALAAAVVNHIRRPAQKQQHGINAFCSASSCGMATLPALALFIAGAETQELQRLARVHGLEDGECDDREEASAMVLSFLSSADRRTVIANELRDVFSLLCGEADLIASLLESTDLCVSAALMSQLSDISESAGPFTMLHFDAGSLAPDVFARAPGLSHAHVFLFFRIR